MAISTVTIKRYKRTALFVLLNPQVVN